MIVYVCVGNSDDRLTQREWSSLWEQVSAAVSGHATVVHGQWLSESADPWQNACWCAEIPDDAAGPLRMELAALGRAFRQDAVTWAPAPVTEFL